MTKDTTYSSEEWESVYQQGILEVKRNNQQEYYLLLIKDRPFILQEEVLELIGNANLTEDERTNALWRYNPAICEVAHKSKCRVSGLLRGLENAAKVESDKKDAWIREYLQSNQLV